MRAIGLDVGDVRIGVAMSDPTRTISSVLTTIHRLKVKAVDAIKEIVEEHNITTIVYGLPISLDGTEKRQAEKVREFIQKLQNKVKVEYVSVDERFSTKSAFAVLEVQGKKKKDKKKHIDEASAVIILDSFLRRK